MEEKKWFFIIGISFLCFFAFPIRVKQTSDADQEILFKLYIKNFNKSYDENNVDYLIRFENFKMSLRLIEELNKNTSTNEGAVYGLTEYSDLSQEEFAKSRLQNTIKKFFGIEYHRRHTLLRSYPESGRETTWKPKRSTLPTRVDWREKGVIGSVRNQKNCGACWAFSAIETVEAMNAKKFGSLVELSVQEMIDCAKSGNYGCDGGDSCSLLKWLVETKAKVTTEKMYPFAYKANKCKTKSFKVGVQVQNFTCDSYVGAEEELLETLARHGPVAVAVNALHWQYYLGGIIQFHCPGAPDNLNHAVQIVGYDVSALVPHYIVRNSWGTTFGDKGYLYIGIGKNLCGLANEVTSLDVL